jgi:hypothetical protein
VGARSGWLQRVLAPQPEAMVMSVERLLSLLRGRTTVHLVRGATRLLEPSLYPFKADEVPLMGDLGRADLGGIDAYTSGFRSVVLPASGGWLKAKAIGIPAGSSRPFLVGDRICTYWLSDVNIGAGRLIWGFSTVDEAENELRRTIEAREAGCPAPMPVGVGLYGGVTVIDLRDRMELFTLLASETRESLLERFRLSGRTVEATCVFMAQPTDVRVDEVLYGFLHPAVEDFIPHGDCRDFLRWLGSSCSSNLKAHHDAGLLHGTVRKDGGFMTNSHTANHLVDEEGTYTTDYHMAYRSDDGTLRETEVYFLASQMNPLPRAAEAAGRELEPAKPLIYEMPPDEGTIIPTGQFGGRFFSPANRQEEYTGSFLDGVIYGYNRRRVRQVESRLRREALLAAAVCKRELFRLLQLPEGMERGTDQVAKRLATRRFTEEELRDSRARLERELG